MSTKRWKNQSDYLNHELFKHLIYRTSEGIPIIRAYNGNLPDTLVPVNIKAGRNKNACKNCGYVKENLKVLPPQKREGFAHFYLDDYQFERFWNSPLRLTNYLKTFQGALSPDFSLYSDYTEIEQYINLYKSRALGAYWQSKGIPIIPSISWNNQQSFNWCFKGVEQNSIVSISTVGCMRTPKLKEHLLIGYSEMITQLKPTKVVIYGRYPKELDEFGLENINIKSFQDKFSKGL